VRLTWSLLAISDRESIFKYIAADNPLAAVDLDELFERKAALLIDHPNAGRVGRVAGTRELVAHRHYVFVYDIQADRVRILRVLHTALQYPPPTRRAKRQKPKKK
jgi:addiction module RelE/StbE family toxin